MHAVRGVSWSISDVRAELRILGPFEARVSGRPAPQSRPTVRRLLAVLLLSAGQVVSDDRLIELIFEPSYHSKSGLHVTVSRLRRWLTDNVGGSAAVEREGSGYFFVPSTVAVDCAQFTAYADAQAPDSAYRMRDLMAGLAIWRGPVLEDMPEQIRTAPEAVCLERKRIDCTCELAQVAIDMGQAASALPLVEPLAMEHPFDEPLQAALIRLLNASGRRAMALQCFEQTRRLLAEDLGVGPSGVLAEAHMELLRQEPEPPGAPPLVCASDTPTELPPDLDTFTGRRAELARLCMLLSQKDDAHAHVAAIAGAAGLGKSALALQAAHLLAGKFPDGQLYVNLDGATPGVSPMTTLDALRRLLRSLGVDDVDLPANPGEAAARYRSLLTGRRMLILLDNAVDAEQVRPLIPAGPTNRVVVTSRRVLAMLENTTHISLTEFSPDESVTLLEKLVGAQRVRAEPMAAVRIAQLCCHLPFALRIAGARLLARPNMPLMSLALRLSKTRNRLDELECGNVRLRDAFAVSYQGLRERTARVFRLSGLIHTSDLTPSVCAAAADISVEDAERALDQLVGAQMVAPHAAGRYRMHELIRLFARERAQSEDPVSVRHSAVKRVVESYLASARRVNSILHPSYAVVNGATACARGLDSDDREGAVTWLDHEASNLVTVAKQACNLPVGDRRLAKDLATVARLLMQDRRPSAHFG